MRNEENLERKLLFLERKEVRDDEKQGYIH